MINAGDGLNVKDAGIEFSHQTLGYVPEMKYSSLLPS